MKHSIKFLSLFLIFSFLCISMSSAQFMYFPYYGKNKVLYEKFDWSHYKTEHFDIHYYVDNLQILKNIAEMAESAYQRISEDLKHQLTAPVPLIYYMTYTDFEQTNLFQISEGILGVAEPILHRIAIYGDMTLDETQDLIEHEITHIFQFDLLWGSPGGPIYAFSAPPGWVMEGLCEYNTQNWSSWSTLIVRDATLNDRIPELTKSGHLYSRHPLPRTPDYDFGHAMYEFIESKYGKNGIREFWKSMKHSSFLGKRAPIKKVFNLDPKEFNYEFKKYLRLQFKDFLLRENPEDYSIPIGPEFPLNPYYFSFSHALSPSGDIVAVLTANLKESDIDILLFSTKDGSVIKNITKGHTLKYEHIRFELDPAKGKDIAWSPDGDKICFFARAGQKYSLFILNALTGKTLRAIKLPLDQPSSPCFFPEGEDLLFTAFHKGIHDIFKINLETEKILNLTEDDLFEKAPTISPLGDQVSYTIRVDTYDKIFLSPIDNFKKKTQLTFGRGNTIAPQFSQDSKTLYFSGDMRDAFNIYSLNLETGDLKRYTDVRTGNFFPVPLPNNTKTIVFTSFNKGSFQVFKSEFEGEVEKTITFVEKKPDEKFKRFEPIISLDIKEEKIEPYKGMGKLYLTSRPPIDAIVSTDGSIYGGSALTFSDLLGDYSFSFIAYQVRSFRSYMLAYLNQKRRLQYMVNAYQYTLFYYPSYYYYDPTYYNYSSYRDAIRTQKITGINVSAYYPFSKFYRVQGGIGYYNFEDEYLQLPSSSMYGGYQGFPNGNILSTSLSLVGETTRFKFYGPSMGNTFKLSFSQSLPIGSFLQNTNVDVDLRQYINIGANALFAFRFEGFLSRGKNPYIYYFGGNNQVRSSNYYNIIANEGWFANAEFRFPLINAASSLIGPLGPIRGVLFFDVARAKIKGFPAKFYTLEGYDISEFDILPIYRVADVIGSYGYGFEFFLLGLPIHLEFVKRIEIADISEPFKIDIFGKFETKFWIGFDF